MFPEAGIGLHGPVANQNLASERFRVGHPPPSGKEPTGLGLNPRQSVKALVQNTRGNREKAVTARASALHQAVQHESRRRDATRTP